MPAFSFLLHFLSEEIKINLNLGMKWGIFLKKVRKGLAALLCLLSFVAVLTACGVEGNDSASSAQGTVSSTVSQVLETMKGTVAAISDTELTLQMEDGMEYKLPLTAETKIENTISDSKPLSVGSVVTVSYYGSLLLTGSLETGVQVVSVAVESTPDTEKSQPEESQPTTTSSKAEKILASMSMEEKIGQMFIVRCPETDAAALAEEYQVGGYILFGRDFEDQTVSGLQAAIESYQDSVNIPMFVGVDEEGGTVVRASAYPQFRDTPFESPQQLYAEGGMDRILEDIAEKSAFLEKLGINLNFAPVSDVSTNPNDYINPRAFGKNGKATAKYVSQVVTAMKKAGMGSVLKHFPGYGNNVDTHTGISYDNRDYSTFETSDFLPFEAGIKAGADCILVSHNIVACMDEDMPASLSPEVHRILREELGYDGVVMTDDLVMDAIRAYTDNGTAAVAAVQAGNDLLCCTDFTEQIPAVIEAVNDGTISESHINESVLRILQAKINLGIIS